MRSSQKARCPSTPETVHPSGIGCESWASLSRSVTRRSRASWSRFSATYDRSVAMMVSSARAQPGLTPAPASTPEMGRS